MKKLICNKLLLCLLVLLSSCETVVELELPAQEPALVANAVINPDSLFIVDVSSSQSALAVGSHLPVTNAIVQVYQASQHLYTLEHKGSGIYSISQLPQALQHYQLKVEAPGFPTATAATYIPATPAISKLKATPVAGTEWDGPSVSASFMLSDTPDQENYYYIQAYTPDTNYSDGQHYNRSVRVKMTVPFEDEFTMEDRYFFSDKLFEGKAVTLRLNLENSPENTTFVRIAHITRDYYEYVRTLDRQSYRDNFATLPEPVTNNIQGGMGLFGGYNAVTLAVKP
ncbi:DUF4249 domain-containing protein [Pontibacter pudoricolor]|uniref:DUF4249 domain-containing protein n=1 Tax=Pontibacter pudoricolor TaxID=2694930 RepID=UPI001391B8D7|nr:DUF4249 domain-containing protein [Pontibacter pudoricolor]